MRGQNRPRATSAMNAILLLVVVALSSSTALREPPEIFENVRTKYRLPAGTKTFKLSCPVKTKSDDDTVMVRWSKDEELISNDWSSHYKLLNSNRELKIRNVQLSDGGRFKCMVINGFGHREVEFSLDVYDPARVDARDAEEITLSEEPSKPMWHDKERMDTKNTVQINPGDSLKLGCAARGNPLPRITWFKNTQPIQLDETHDPTSARLQVDGVDASDAGTYVCRLENAHGSLEHSFRVVVGTDVFTLDDIDNDSLFSHISDDGSMVIDQPFNSTVRAGHTAQFQCRVRWQQQTHIRWLKSIEDPIAAKRVNPNATILHLNNMHLLVLEQPNGATHAEAGQDKNVYVNQLIINDVASEDAGRYFCVVTNTAGQFVYRSAVLQVVNESDFIPFATAPNVAFVVVVFLVLALVTIAVAWLCCNGVTSGSSNADTSTDHTKLSCDSADCCAPSLKKSIIQPPPPPSIPVPQTPSMSPAKKFDSLFRQQQAVAQHYNTAERNAWIPPAHQNAFLSATVDRRYRPSPQQMLHRTARAEDEFSHLSSNIYDSGSAVGQPMNCRSPQQASMPPHAYSPRCWAHTLPLRAPTPVSSDEAYDVGHPMNVPTRLPYHTHDQRIPFMSGSPRW